MVTGGALRSSDVFGLTGTVFDGRFEVERKVAEGGFAVVYKARHLALDRLVALKVLKTPRGYDDAARTEFQQKFAAEAKTIARLKHPHIVDVHDFAIGVMPSGESAPWMALGWLDGETLATRLERRRQLKPAGLTLREALDLFRPIAQALAFAHRLGIVHRDVKPANIMLVGDEPSPSPRVLDFGIAKLIASERPAGAGDTRTDSVPTFTPSYAAPEQVSYSRTGPWTDVHALGLILTELLTDQPPYVDDDAHLFELVMSPSRPTPASKGRDVGAFEPIIAKALAFSPRERWADAGEMLAVLEASLGSPEGAGAPTVRMNPPSSPSEADPAAGLGPPPALAKGPRRAWIWPLLAIAGIGVASVALLRGRPQAPPVPVAVEPPPRPPAPEAPPSRPLAPVVPERPSPPVVSHPAVRPEKPARPSRPARSAPRPAATNEKAQTEAVARPKDLFDDTR